ncbi:uncharacterized protein LOC126621427 [Malus sylvestris]|uniref:uncharacterized protein LOC126621427 n=1 Tax=Malus sylvestris TaxID=3752 RepID=UPI0021ACE49C|nr:uncharacterized protein LOC126621427 [Malus sylvestris]
MESGGGSASGSLGKSQLSRKKSFAMSHEDSSNPEGYGLVLYLRLSCGGGGGKDMGTCRPEADWFPWSGKVYTTVSEEKQQANQQTPRVPELEKHRKPTEYIGG